ncbi:restriction endonuclease subunit S [Paenibacillus sp. M1]|uniref:Restriction endonuclease subunit S n=1 Tax=Paenibacillus haidiansis TaxID=1574488 RepID=A0ABU7VUL0_9BACL
MSFEPFNGMTPPNEWKARLVKDIAVVNERSIKKSDRIDTIQYIDIAAVNHRNIDQLQTFKLNDAPSRARRIVQDNDILISTVRPNLKHYTMIRKAEPDMIASTGFAVISPKRVHPDFLYYYLTSDSYTRYLTQIAEGQTSAYPAFNSDIIENTVIYLPPENEQCEIGEMLASVDKKIELNNAINKNLEEMTQALFKRWFVDFEFPNENVEPYKSSGGEFEESELGLIPKGWKIGRIGDIASNRTQTVRPEEIPSGTKYIGLEHIPRKKLAISHFGVSDELESNKLWFYKGDILFGKLRPYFHKVSIAPFDGVCSTDILSINSKRDEFYGYLVFQLFSERLVDYVTQSSNGTKMPRTNWRDMSNYSIVIPPMEIAEKFTTVVRGFVSMMTNNIYENMNLSNIRDTLLPKLMSGEIRIPVEQDHSAPYLPMVAERSANYQP